MALATLPVNAAQKEEFLEEIVLLGSQSKLIFSIDVKFSKNYF